jgi:membrane associated rhomboid family serine protease
MRVATTGPIVTYVFLAVNVAIFVLVPGTASPRVGEYSLWGPGIDVNGEWYRIVTSAFLHGSLLHLGFNMFALYRVGPVVEQALGWARFLALYILSLLGGSLLALTLEPTGHTVGASGALFGVFGALYVLLTRKGISPWSTGIGGLIVVNLVITFAVPIISVGGHVGGLVAGGLAVFLLEPARDGWRSNTALAISGAVVAACVLFGAAYFVALQSTPF